MFSGDCRRQQVWSLRLFCLRPIRGSVPISDLIGTGSTCFEPHTSAWYSVSRKTQTYLYGGNVTDGKFVRDYGHETLATISLCLWPSIIASYRAPSRSWSMRLAVTDFAPSSAVSARVETVSIFSNSARNRSCCWMGGNIKCLDFKNL